MENALVQWQNRWGKLYQNVRLKWISQLSPDIIAFFNDIKWVYGEGKSYGMLSCTLYFKSKGKTWELTIQKSHITDGIKNFHIRKYHTEHYLINYGFNTLHIRKPLQTKDEGQLIVDFFEEIMDEMIKVSNDISEEREINERKEFDELMKRITIVGYDNKYEELILSNGKRVPVSGMFHELKKERKEMIVDGKSIN